MIIKTILMVSLAYLLGSICWAYILGKAVKKIDIRKYDNPGVAGAWRQLGPKWGTLVALLDISKAALPVYLAKVLFLPDYIPIILVVLAVTLGHNWPIFLQFKGGMGMGPNIGALLVLLPKEFGIAFLIACIVGFGLWLLLKRKKATVAYGALIGYILMSVLTWKFKEPQPLFILTLLLFGLVIIRQIPPVKRLTERRQEP
jgi:glycerol-3-phosphate acyltransferase PlsY